MSKILTTLVTNLDQKERLEAVLGDLGILMSEIGASHQISIHSVYLQVGEMVEVEATPRDKGLQITYKGDVLSTEYHLPVVVK